MGCINPDGSLNSVALDVLRALAVMSGSGTAESVARATGLPLYRARASLRELQSAGFVTGGKDLLQLSAAGAERLQAAAVQPIS